MELQLLKSGNVMPKFGEFASGASVHAVMEADFVPRNLALQSKKGFGLPHEGPAWIFDAPKFLLLMQECNEVGGSLVRKIDWTRMARVPRCGRPSGC